jgi:diguanylate cyclase (GGDEF)-like protein
MVIYLLLVDFGVILGTGSVTIRDLYAGPGDWLGFAALAVGAVAHLWFVRRAEESRRDRSEGPHIDMTSVWALAAALTLPLPFVVAIVVLVRVLLYPIARRPMFRFVYSAMGFLAAAVLAALVFDAVAPAGPLGLVAGIFLAGAVFFSTQAVMIAVAFKISLPEKPLLDALGSREDNLTEALTLFGGALVGLAAVATWWAPLLAIPMVMAVNKMLEERSQLVADATTDHRTGLLNTRGWRERAERVLRRAAHDEHSVAVLVVDLDHFKLINDTWGHPAGDTMLHAVAQVLLSEVRDGDVVGRDGGEEFVVVLPDASWDEAARVGERIRAGVARLIVPATDKRREPILISDRTASIGVAVLPDCGPDLASVQHAADAAVYAAKESGRDQVRLALPRIPEPRVIAS